jgi:hypothetical protein
LSNILVIVKQEFSYFQKHPMIYTLQITLQNRKPLNQRIIQISDNKTFAELSQIICDLYDFSGEHLWEYQKEDSSLIINHPEYEITPVDLKEFAEEDFGDLQEVAENVSSKVYKLSDYFFNNTKIKYMYDFGENWCFEILFTRADEDIPWFNGVKIIWGQGTYLIEDSGGPEGLKEYLQQYAKQQRDGDRWETQEDFAERIQPAMQDFKAHKHPQYL